MEKFHEKESSKRSWPWKKKTHDKVSAAPELAGSSPVHSSRLVEDHQKWDYHHQEVSMHQYQPSPPRVQTVLPKYLKEAKDAHEQEKDAHDRSRAALDEARIQWKQAEERARIMNEKLATALADITTKDNLVKQHVKVAEEAVTGWEKAEAEAVALKTQLDVALQQKLATEDRVAHLDGALKECMKQLRHVREEQEQRIHDTLVKKTREYDKLRAEMEAKLAESSHFLTQTRNDLLESRAEVTALAHALQERTRSIAEMSEAKGRTETEIKVLQVRLETIEKENSQLKYEVHVLNKELEIRSEEREYERKAVDMASKQHLESVKKIAKLEEECNRLRLLVRKKLPGPAAIQRMRMEVEGIGKDNNEKSRRRSLGRSASSVEYSAADSMQENGNENGRQTREAQMLAERVVAMDEEMKILKEALTQRNNELQVARHMCSKTATRLSVVEEELNRAKQQNGPLKLVNGPIVQKLATSKSDFDQKQGKGVPDSSLETRRDSQNFELMDDFALMERLAMTEALTESGMATQTVSMSQEVDSKSAGQTQQQLSELEEALAAKEHELGKADEMCRDLKTKLTAAEKQITTLQNRLTANETNLINLQDQLDRLNEARQEQEKSGVISHVRTSSNSKGLSGYTIKDILVKAGSKSGQIALASDESSSQGGAHEEHACVSDAESKASTVHSELAVAIRKIIHIVEAFAQATGSDYSTLNSNQSDMTSCEVSLQFEWENLALDNIMRNLAHVSNRFLQGKYDLIDFVTELGTALDSILALKPQAARNATSEINNGLISAQQELKTELERLKCEKAEIESHFAEATEQVKLLKAQLHEGKQLVAGRRIHVQGGESPDPDIGMEDDMIEEELLQLSSPNPALRAASGELSKMHDKVAALEKELNGERQRYESVVVQLTALQQQVRRGGHAVSSEMSGLSHGDSFSHSTSEDEDEDEDDGTESLKKRRLEAAKKEEEERRIAAAALAECQRTILALSKQLKGVGPVPELDQPSPNSSSSTESASSIQKMTENMELLRWQTEAGSAMTMHNHTPSGLRDRGSPWNNPAGPRRAPRSPSPANSHASNSSNDHHSSFHRRSESGNEQIKTRTMESGSPNNGINAHPGLPEAHADTYSASLPGSPSAEAALNPNLNGASGVRQDKREGEKQHQRSPSSFTRFYSRSASNGNEG